MSYQEVTGCLCANSHPGSYTSQDAYNDMLIVDTINDLFDRQRSTASDWHESGLQHAGLYARSSSHLGRERERERERVGMDSEQRYIVRRLTPKECGRLQGFPDDWCDGVQGSDAAQYKMWGNGCCLPCVLFVMQGIVQAAERDGMI